MNRKTFTNILIEEKTIYFRSASEYKTLCNSKHKRYMIWKYLYYFRCCQYWKAERSNMEISKFQRKIAKYKFRHYNKKKNEYSWKSGVEIGIDSKIGKNCDIWHSGVVINGNIGDNCVFHGNNIIGNKGKHNELQVPDIGNGVDIGAGAILIGNISIADESVIGAGSVVTKNFGEKRSVIVGVPARVLMK